MKTLLATTVVILLLAASPPLCFAADTNSGTSTEGAADTDSQSSAAPAGTGSGQDKQEEMSDDKQSSDGDLMQNVTRHRPGACPEGPPCKSED
jgi:hypothetical protein